MTATSEAVSPQIVWIDISNSQQRLPLMVVSRKRCPGGMDLRLLTRISAKWPC